ncbi:MAG: tyrosine-protein phosphatase [Chloroflexi bacterium]|nr:tyrosine-protein phosphatase [Chloroflexota bacterium]
MDGGPRRVLDDQIAGAVNFRDIGGYPAMGGRVRWGQVYRAGFIHVITPAGLEQFVRSLRIRTVIDLRTPAERQLGQLPLRGHGIRYHAASLLETDNAPPHVQFAQVLAMLRGSFDWAASYLALVRRSPEVLCQVFTLLAEPGALPALVHCSAGRDRTGIVIALLLAVLGVPAEQIAQDYALSGELLLPHLHHFAGMAADLGLSTRELARLVETTPATMRAFLEGVVTTAGSAEGLLLASGVAPATLQTLRQRLIEPAA